MNESKAATRHFCARNDRENRARIAHLDVLNRLHGRNYLLLMRKMGNLRSKVSELVYSFGETRP